MESQGREKGLVPSYLGMTRSSHLCLLLLGQEKAGVEISNWLCTDAISSLGGKSTALKAIESPLREGDLLLLGTVSSHLDSRWARSRQ